MNILAIGAHADDIELGCGGTLARYRDNGANLIIYTATASGGKNPYGGEIRNKKESLEDGERAAHILKAKLIIGSFETNEVEFIDSLNSELIKVICDNKIDTMFTHWIHDAHHDHYNLSRASLHVGRHLNNILMYKSNWYQTMKSFEANIYFDISDYWATKERLLRCYRREMERTNGEWIVYNRNIAENYGMIIGKKYAEAFSAIKWTM